MQQGGQQELLLIANLFQDTYIKKKKTKNNPNQSKQKTPNPNTFPFMKYIAEMIGAAAQIASGTKGGSGI